MAKVVLDVSVSLDGFAAGPNVREAEPMGDGAGFGDFDGKLVVVAGPARIGDQVLLGGVVEISIGKSPDRQIRLGAGTMVSRAHAKRLRLDFGPSRWHLEDTNSTNGVLARRAVSSSPSVMLKPPSPVSPTTRRVGAASCAPMLPGRP